MNITYTMDDVEAAERRYGSAYFLTHNKRFILPITHVGPNTVGLISCDIGRGFFVYAKLWDAYTGELLLWDEQRNYAESKAGWVRCVRHCLNSLYINNCKVRVNPGDRGPWFDEVYV